MKLTGEDSNGNRWSGELTPIENAIKEGTSPAIVTGTPQRIGNTLYPNATEASLRKAIDESWRYYQDNYDTYELEEGVNYPSEAWARSQGAKTLPIELPASEIRIHEDIEVPANMQIRGVEIGPGQRCGFMMRLACSYLATCSKNPCFTSLLVADLTAFSCPEIPDHWLNFTDRFKICGLQICTSSAKEAYGGYLAFSGCNAEGNGLWAGGYKAASHQRTEDSQLPIRKRQYCFVSHCANEV